MGNLNIAPTMIIASPEAREALAKGAVSAKDTVAKHAQTIKDVAGTDSAKAIALGTAAGFAAGALSPVPGGALIGGATGAAAAAAVVGAKKAAENPVRTATLVGLLVGPLPGLATYAFCSGKAQAAFDKMLKFVKEHPEALLAKAAL